MRYSEFWELVEDVFGPQIGRVLVADQVIGALDDRTGARALEEGVDPRTVWRALCDAMEVPESRRWGTDVRRPTKG